MHLGPFLGRKSLDHSVRTLARVLGLRTCPGRLAPSEDFSPCIYGQMGHCTAPCNLSIAGDAYAERVRRALGFLRGRSGPLLGELARGRDQAARALRYEEAARMCRDLESLATLANRTSRLSQVVTENNLVIVTGQGASCTAYVVLSGRLAMVRALDARDAAEAIAAFVADNFERYRARPIERGELEAMTIVARWLRERAPDEGRLIYLSGARLDPAALYGADSRPGAP
jgi:excinuclease UvrABC nuclease subunit